MIAFENSVMSKKDTEAINLSLMENSKFPIHMTGEIVDRIYKNGEFIE